VSDDLLLQLSKSNEILDEPFDEFVAQDLRLQIEQLVDVGEADVLPEVKLQLLVLTNLEDALNLDGAKLFELLVGLDLLNVHERIVEGVHQRNFIRVPVLPRLEALLHEHAHRLPPERLGVVREILGIVARDLVKAVEDGAMAAVLHCILRDGRLPSCHRKRIDLSRHHFVLIVAEGSVHLAFEGVRQSVADLGGDIAAHLFEHALSFFRALS